LKRNFTSLDSAFQNLKIFAGRLLFVNNTFYIALKAISMKGIKETLAWTENDVL